MTTRPWREVVARGLGDRRTVTLGILLIGAGVAGKLALLRYANIETVFAASLLAGSLLGRWWTVLVPLSVLAILQPLQWGALYGDWGYPVEAMLGITFFVATGFLFIALVGRALKPRILLRVKSVALLTTVSVPLTVAYDLWTAVGEWYFLTRRAGMDLGTLLQLQIPFTAYHLLSSLIFVPLLGSAFLVLRSHLAEAPRVHETPQEDGGA